MIVLSVVGASVEVAQAELDMDRLSPVRDRVVTGLVSYVTEHSVCARLSGPPGRHVDWHSPIGRRFDRSHPSVCMGICHQYCKWPQAAGSILAVP